jgi:hypothetical protein
MIPFQSDLNLLAKNASPFECYVFVDAKSGVARTTRVHK